MPSKKDRTENLSHVESFHARGLTTRKSFLERLQLLIDQRHLCQFCVDRETEPPVELIKQPGFPA
jgi:hypothetical protein